METGEIDFRVYLITDRHQAKRGGLLEVLEEALESGIGAIQLREKDMTGRDLFQLASEARKLTARYGAKLFVNDRIDVALSVTADGVHLGEASIPVADAKRICGGMTVGRSTHSLQSAKRAEEEGADFLTFGPVFKTPSKEAFGPPAGVVKLAEVVRAVGIPVFALGGIKPDTIDRVMAEGKPFGVALISAIIAAPSPGKAAALVLEKTAVHG